MICLDSSILIQHFRAKRKELTPLFQLSDEYQKLFITTITTFEVFRGSNVAQAQYWEMIFEKMTVLSFDEEASKIASDLFLKLKSKTT
jgi:predicted nucleic acid-binding protein